MFIQESTDYLLDHSAPIMEARCILDLPDTLRFLTLATESDRIAHTRRNSLMQATPQL